MVLSRLVILMFWYLGSISLAADNPMEQGNAALAKGDYARAIALLTAAIEKEPDNATAYATRGMAYYSKQDYDRAIADYSEVIRLKPTLGRAYAARAVAYKEKAEFDKAIADFEEAIRLTPQEVELREGLASAHFGRARRSTDRNKKVSDYNEAIRLRPAFVEAWVNRGLAHERGGDYEKALTDYSEAVRLDPTGIGGLNAAAWLLATCPKGTLRNGKQAVEFGKKAYELTDGKDTNVLDTLAAAYAEAGDFESAIKLQKAYLEAPRLNSNAAAQGRLRMGLYESHNPFHESN
jgi:Flp pilus assembly protein TadD